MAIKATWNGFAVMLSAWKAKIKHECGEQCRHADGCEAGQESLFEPLDSMAANEGDPQGCAGRERNYDEDADGIQEHLEWDAQRGRATYQNLTMGANRKSNDEGR